MKKTIRKKTLLIVGSSVTVLFSLFAFTQRDDFFEISKNLDIFATLYREVNLYYVDEVQPGTLMKEGIDAMLESLDPYTNFISEDEIEDARFMTTGQYGGIGAMIRMRDEQIMIAEPYENSPAQKADLRAGDIIVEVEGKSTKGKNTGDVVKILKGQPKTDVRITIRREGVANPIEKTLTREEIKVNNVPYFGMLNEHTGYIRLSGFTEDAGREVKDALVSLKENKALTGVVLDLRGNPGGLLREAINIVNVFVDKGIEIVSTKGKLKEWDKTYRSLNPPVDLDIPLAVLVNRSSASASEIVSGALQDLDRAVIIGQRSFGKGLVQTSRPLSYNTQLKITTSKYYIPSGRCIQAKDYSNRNEDGSVGSIPDSLIKEFKTKNGRKVYDGGGINPDVGLQAPEYAPITRSLAENNIIFDFATRYCNANAKPSDLRNFRIDDKLFNEFVAFSSTKEYTYETESEQLLRKLKEAAEKENYFSSFETEYKNLKEKMMHDKHHDLEKARDEICRILGAEIASRYQYQRGRIEQSFAFDQEIQRAIAILNDKAFYQDVLNGKYVEEIKKKGK